MSTHSQQPYFPSMPISINPSTSTNSRKRKMQDDFESESNQRMQFDGFNDNSSNKKAKLVPLGAEENLRTLASLGYLPGSNNNSFHPIPFSSQSNFGSSEGPSSPTSSSVGTPEDSTCPLPSFFNQDPVEGRFEGTASYPKFDIYPSSNKHNNMITSQSHSGILQPDMSPSSEDHMDLDGGDMMMDRGHGPHCKSIPQLSVKYADGKESSLWATCVDCGASSKVQSNQPATGLAFSP